MLHPPLAYRWLVSSCLLAISLLSLPLPSSGQTSWCRPLRPEQPLPLRHDPGRPRQVVTIPVVVHIVWHEAAENLSEERILSQIEVLNEDFRALNADQEAVWVEFQDDIADLELEFALATAAPGGAPTNGIVRVQTSNPVIGGAEPVNGQRPICYDELGGSTAWFPGCYLNIWVGNLPQGVAGQGTFPGSAPPEEDGVFIAPDRFGRNDQPPYDLGRTLTHEIGHWLNLYHLWGPETLPDDPCPAGVCCNDPAYDDLVDDTPKQVATYAQACPTPPQQTCGSRDMFQNFMGLSEDACLLFFTPGQKERVWQTLQEHRSGFLEPACITRTTEAGQTWQARTWTTRATLWLELPPGGKSDWVVFDLWGRPVHVFQLFGGGRHSEELHHLPPGIYGLRGRNRTQQTAKKIIIVNQ